MSFLKHELFLSLCMTRTLLQHLKTYSLCRSTWKFGTYLYSPPDIEYPLLTDRKNTYFLFSNRFIGFLEGLNCIWPL
uniref:Uncharacterized protein n=1 Tax=Populus trichocarpa TaxID=3694 RepID=A0A3N7GE73_POPTR